MRTVCGLARRAQVVVGGGRSAAGERAPSEVRGRPLLLDDLGEQRRGGVRLDQVDATTCGSAVLVALAAWADPTEPAGLDRGGAGFGDRYDARQRQVHRETNRCWPRALGTTPWGMVRWLRWHVPAAGRYRVRLVDDTCAADLDDAVASAGSALRAGRPVPPLVGAGLPRHYVLALSELDGGWRVYEPSSGSVRCLDPGAVRARRCGPVAGFDRLHALLLAE